MTPESTSTSLSIRQRENNLVKKTIERIENRRYMIRTLTGQENPTPSEVRTALDTLQRGIESFRSQLKMTHVPK